MLGVCAAHLYHFCFRLHDSSYLSQLCDRQLQGDDAVLNVLTVFSHCVRIISCQFGELASMNVYPSILNYQMFCFFLDI